jgi:hypothetical protein
MRDFGRRLPHLFFAIVAYLVDSELMGSLLVLLVIEHMIILGINIFEGRGRVMGSVFGTLKPLQFSNIEHGNKFNSY